MALNFFELALNFFPEKCNLEIFRNDAGRIAGKTGKITRLEARPEDFVLVNTLRGFNEFGAVRRLEIEAANPVPPVRSGFLASVANVLRRWRSRKRCRVSSQFALRKAHTQNAKRRVKPTN